MIPVYCRNKSICLSRLDSANVVNYFLALNTTSTMLQFLQYYYREIMAVLDVDIITCEPRTLPLIDQRFQQ